MTAAPREVVQVLPVTQARVIDSERIKFFSLRSTWLTLLATAVAMIGFGGAVSWVTNARWSHLDPHDLQHFNAIDRSLSGVDIAQLAVMVLGVLVIAGEFSTGMIRASLSAVPRRLPVLWAKIVVFAAATFVLTLVSAFVVFLLGQQLLGSHGTGITADGATRAILGIGLYLTAVGVLALALGTIVRNTAGGIAAIFALMLVIPGLVGALPDSWQKHILPYLPSEAGGSVYAVVRDPNTLGPWSGYLVLLVWVAVAVAVAAVTLRRRDI